MIIGEIMNCKAIYNLDTILMIDIMYAHLYQCIRLNGNRKLNVITGKKTRIIACSDHCDYWTIISETNIYTDNI